MSSDISTEITRRCFGISLDLMANNLRNLTKIEYLCISLKTL
jgi:hypothetical protein